MKKPAILIPTIPLLLYLFVVAYIYYDQEQRLFQHQQLPDDHHLTYDYDYEEHFFAIDPATKINAILIKVPDPKGIILYFHGSGCHLGDPWDAMLGNFTQHGYSVLMSDYRGFGKSRGTLSEEALLSDAKILYQFTQSHFPEKDIIVYGKSLGSGIATYIASEFNPRKLILESPYLSVLDLAPKAIPFLPQFIISWLIKYPFRTDQWIQNVTVPIHIFHGIHDQTIPYDSSKRLLSQIADDIPVAFTTIHEGTHKLLHEQSEYQAHLSEILDICPNK